MQLLSFSGGVVGQELVLQVSSQYFASPLRNQTASEPQIKRQQAKTKADALKW